MQLQQDTANLRTYNAKEVASHYAALDYLTPCERFLFDAYVTPGMSVLDLGVGGGRTTPALSRIASDYIGVDYSEEMIRMCRSKFPQLEFRVADASDLSTFSDDSFDAIVMAFNGLDYILPEDKRRQCLSECRRVLRPGGIFIFSSHNPRSLLVRPAWNRERLRALARRLAPEQSAAFQLVTCVLTVAKAGHALLRAIAESSERMVRRLPQSAFWRGEGYLFDPSHGGLTTHCWLPQRVIGELARFDFQLVTVLGDDYPSKSRTFVTDWYYYVFSKINSSANGELCV
jgi:ubiquinone/menaquinone biosynthesis C-methylase UbiE